MRGLLNDPIYGLNYSGPKFFFDDHLEDMQIERTSQIVRQGIADMLKQSADGSSTAAFDRQAQIERAHQPRTVEGGNIMTTFKFPRRR